MHTNMDKYIQELYLSFGMICYIMNRGIYLASLNEVKSQCIRISTEVSLVKCYKFGLCKLKESKGDTEIFNETQKIKV